MVAGEGPIATPGKRAFSNVVAKQADFHRSAGKVADGNQRQEVMPRRKLCSGWNGVCTRVFVRCRSHIGADEGTSITALLRARNTIETRVALSRFWLRGAKKARGLVIL